MDTLWGGDTDVGESKRWKGMWRGRKATACCGQRWGRGWETENSKPARNNEGRGRSADWAKNERPLSSEALSRVSLMASSSFLLWGGGLTLPGEWDAISPVTQGPACAVLVGFPLDLCSLFTHIGCLASPITQAPLGISRPSVTSLQCPIPQHQSQKVLSNSQTWLCPTFTLQPSRAPMAPGQSPSLRFSITFTLSMLSPGLALDTLTLLCLTKPLPLRSNPSPPRQHPGGPPLELH